MKTSRTKAMLGGVLAVTVLASAACGSSGTGTSSGSTSGSTSSSSNGSSPSASSSQSSTASVASAGSGAQSSSAAGSTSKASGKAITIGLMVPLTGDLAQPGGWIQDGVKYGVQQVNAAGGINGSDVKVVTVDTGGDPTQSVTAANKLMNQDGVQFIIGPITSQAMNAVLPAETRNDIAAIGVVGSPKLTPKKMPYGFSLLLNAGDQSKAMIQYAVKEKYTKVAILHDNGEQGISADEVLKQQAAKAGMTVTGDQQYKVGDTDMTAQVLSLKRGDPQALLLYPTDGTDVGHVLKSMQNLSWDVPVIGGYGAHYSGQIATVSGKDSMKNLVATTYAPFGACSAGKIPAATQKFIAGIKKFNPDEFKGLALDLAAASVDSVSIIKQGVEGAGSTSGKAFAAWMEANASSISGLINPSVSTSSESHFLFGASDMVLVHPGKQVSDGVYLRADC